jgi:hypothetical protein
MNKKLPEREFLGSYAAGSAAGVSGAGAAVGAAASPSFFCSSIVFLEISG